MQDFLQTGNRKNSKIKYGSNRSQQVQIHLLAFFGPKIESEGAGAKQKFVKWAKNDAGEERTLVLNGEMLD